MFLSRLLVKEPEKRAGAHSADEVKLDPFFERFQWQPMMRRELAAPWSPPVSDEGDTSMFEAYPDSDEPAVTPCLAVGEDPFADFGLTTGGLRSERSGSVSIARASSDTGMEDVTGHRTRRGSDMSLGGSPAWSPGADGRGVRMSRGSRDQATIEE